MSSALFDFPAKDADLAEERSYAEDTAFTP
jgi:hypothetical protein